MNSSPMASPKRVINALTRIEELRVAACRSAFSFKGKHVDLRIIGERLHVKPFSRAAFEGWGTASGSWPN